MKNIISLIISHNALKNKRTWINFFQRWNGGDSDDSGADTKNSDGSDYENYFNRKFPHVLHSLEYHVICRNCKSVLFKFAEREFVQNESIWVFPTKVSCKFKIENQNGFNTLIFSLLIYFSFSPQYLLSLTTSIPCKLAVFWHGIAITAPSFSVNFPIM